MDPIRHGAMSSQNVWPNGIELREEPTRGPVEFLSAGLGLAGRKHAALFVAVKGFIISPSGGVSTPSPALPQTPGPPFDDVPIPVSE